jgi:hypothetical protein
VTNVGFDRLIASVRNGVRALFVDPVKRELPGAIVQVLNRRIFEFGPLAAKGADLVPLSVMDDGLPGSQSAHDRIRIHLAHGTRDPCSGNGPRLG